MPDRPLAEQLWHAAIASNDGAFPELEPITGAELKTLQRVQRADPNAVGRRVVSSWDGKPIWFRRTKSGVRWYSLTWPQDLLLRGVG